MTLLSLSAIDGSSPCGSFRYKLYCVSCSLCQKRHGWRGTAVYTRSSKTLKIRGLPFDTHGQFDRVYGKREKALNSQHQGTIRRWLWVDAGLHLLWWSSPNASRIHVLKRHVSATMSGTCLDGTLSSSRLPRLESSTADCNNLVVVQAFVEKDFFVLFNFQLVFLKSHPVFCV